MYIVYLSSWLSGLPCLHMDQSSPSPVIDLFNDRPYSRVIPVQHTFIATESINNSMTKQVLR